MNSQQLFRRSRLRLACWYTIAMAGVLSLFGLGMYRALVQSKWIALEREIESLAGTLHDSLEPMLPASGDPTLVLRQIFPDLCLVGYPCNSSPTLIQRHTTGISDRHTYYIRLFDRDGNLLAFSPNQPLAPETTLNPATWQTFQASDGTRYHQFITILHGTNAEQGIGSSHNYTSWGYIQIGRTLAAFDAETRRIQWILAIGFPVALALVAAAGWWLSGLAMQPIYQSYQQQQQFTANVAHELRSPLASLLATVEAILRLPPNLHQNIPPMLQTVERQGRRLSSLITDLLLLTSLEQESSTKTLQPCCLNDLVSDLTEEFLELAIASGIDLTNQVPGFEVYVFGNESQLYRLVSNLLANAIQYTGAGGSVEVSLKCHDRMAILRVKDNGIGIAPVEQKRIFERFYRVHSDRSRKTGGTGLGLAIAQAITRRHRGHITVKSKVGQGSLFLIHLPCIQPHPLRMTHSVNTQTR
ncbi:two-component system sensor histidine kinase RppB [Thalassoporum mexicanum]|uniref:two-component system sensor histidine kinase RppB n=1 Tax=Thalassoporum mexicanum TaxID=3457544 RepID=UPI0005A1747F